ncbi:Serine/threonine protein kinase [Nannocystis exedens]|uniref:Serine/threonine protein kinase n=1 Tax=Nannocystis exedens TaxID=54 RepID=A0A1I1VN32_9BACT|nr:serine/threonine-protein kinase [Nannocystis exedens]PCC72615.1 serine/threonine protein kinase [Nannocystis exedens]SFD83448.1 Serine/threonine protein kinase [Nannocystis exedens]
MNETSDSQRPAAIAATLAGDVDEQTASSSPAESEARRLIGSMPERLGRYRLIERLGSGAMGVVYAARDDALARKVAIKVLLRGATADPHALRRLAREAQAMARIAHPNVVVVHEVGESDGLLFVAMEMVDGVTLDQWCRPAEGPRPDWRARLDVFLQAGRGLAAAHEVGLVHRDFKPSNVLVDARGRARVLDFGLARIDSEVVDAAASIVARGSFDVELTRSGTMLGTPAYMPPEQFEGRPATAASDQFSFCVALYESLAGVRPFAGRTPYALLQTIRSGQIRPPPRDVEAPAALFTILRRGLSLDPARRWPDMPTLLHALERTVRPRQVRRATVALGIAAALAGGFGIAALSLGGEEPCAAIPERLVGVADAERRAQVHAALQASGKPYAAALAASVDAALTDYAEAWARVAVDNCEATRVVGDQSESMLDLRAACLDRRLAGLGAVVDQLLTLDPDASQRALDLIDNLEPLAPCSDRERLGAAVPPPTDPDARARLAAAEQDRTSAVAMRAAGRDKEALVVAEASRAAAAAVGFAPALAETALLVSRLEMELGQHENAAAHLAEATTAAAVAGRDDLLVDAWLAAIWQHSVRGASAEVMATLIRTAEVALARARETPRLAVLFHSTVAHAYQRQSMSDKATAHYDAALALLDSPDVSEIQRLRVRFNRATHLVETDGGELAESTLHAVLADFERLLGVGHPLISNVYYTLANLAEKQGHLERALAEFEKARAIKLAEYGPDHPGTMMTDEQIASVLERLGREDEALARYEDLLARARARHGDRSTTVARILNNMVSLLLQRGALDLAHARAREALAIDSALLGEDHADVAIKRVNLAEVLADRGEHDQALAELERAREVFLRTLGPDHEFVAITFSAAGMSLSALGRHQEALAAFTRARALLVDKFGADYPDLATLDLAFGEALIAADQVDEGLRRVQDGADKLGASEGADSVAAIMARGQLGSCLLRARRLDRAVATLEAAVRDAEAAKISARDVTSLRLALAGALAARGDRERVRALAAPAAASLAPDDPLRADAERLLAGQRPR